MPCDHSTNTVLGSLSLAQLATGMILFTVVLVVDLFLCRYITRPALANGRC